MTSPNLHRVWKSQKKSHFTTLLRLQFEWTKNGEFLKTWILLSNSVTRQVKYTNLNETFCVIFKHCDLVEDAQKIMKGRHPHSLVKVKVFSYWFLQFLFLLGFLLAYGLSGFLLSLQPCFSTRLRKSWSFFQRFRKLFFSSVSTLFQAFVLAKKAFPKDSSLFGIHVS